MKKIPLSEEKGGTGGEVTTGEREINGQKQTSRKPRVEKQRDESKIYKEAGDEERKLSDVTIEVEQRKSLHGAKIFSSTMLLRGSSPPP